MKSLIVQSPRLKPHFIAIAAALLCSACGNVGNLKIGNLDLNKTLQIAENAQKALVPLNEQEEIALGEGIASNLLSLAPLFNDREIQRYVNNVGRWISLQSERPDLPWSFAVIDSNEANAFACPGGYIVITKGLLLQMRNEAELAGVLSHEIVHVIRKHHLNAMQKASGMSATKDAATMLAGSSKTSAVVSKLLTGGTELYSRGLDKDDEYEADRMGVVLAARAGYDPYGLPAMLQSLQAISQNDEGLKLLLETHPSFNDRLNLLDRAMAKNFERFDKQPNLQARFERMMARLLPPKPVVSSKPMTTPKADSPSKPPPKREKQVRKN